MDESIRDVEFTPVEEKTEEKRIRGTALYYSTSQVATILGESDSKIRYYVKEFDELFDDGDISVINKQRRFTQKSIDKLKYFIELKSEGMTIKQIREYCQEIEWDKDKGVILPDSTPLPIQAIASAVREQTNQDLIGFKDDILNSLKEYMVTQQQQYENMKEKLIKEVALTVDEVVSDKMEKFKEDFIKSQNEEREATLKTMDMVSNLHAKLNERKEENNKDKGFFSKLFNKR